MNHEVGPIPERMRRNILLYFGESGRDWLAGLNTLIAETAARWAISLEQPFANLSINYVAPATRADGTQVVLKAGVPNREILTEIVALRRFDGHGAVKLLEADAGRGVMLLERLLPGTSLLALEDDAEAVGIAAEMMRKLRAPVPPEHSFPSVGDWFAGLARVRERFGGSSGPLPAGLFALAEQVCARLLASMDEAVLLHGDLHQDNIVKSARDSWLAIDPKGVVGEPAYEACAFLRNPLPQLLTEMDTRQVLARRVEQFCELLGFDRRRLIGWGLCEAVLSASWEIDDASGSWKEAFAIAEIYARML
ncbi:MAG TPA: aminoglycoside phosphotransferase family protein [Pyrinomonadaceae bacterium]